MQLPFFSHSRLRGFCFLRTFSPARLQICSTRSRPTAHPAICHLRQRGDLLIPVAPVLAGQDHHRYGQLVFIRSLELVRIVAFSAIAPAAGRRAARSTYTLARHAPPHNVAAHGLEVSLGHFLQHLLLQRQFGYQPLQPRILLLQFLHPLGLLHLQPAVLLPPALVSLRRDPTFLARLRRRFPVRYCHLNLPQHRYNLLRFVPLHWHLHALLPCDSLSSQLVQLPPAGSKPSAIVVALICPRHNPIGLFCRSVRHESELNISATNNRGV
jgi:hypothetical protein